MKRITYDSLKKVREAMNAQWFTEPWDMNLIIIRSGKVGEWDDIVAMACTDSIGREVVRRYRATGDAWEGEWLKPTHPDGCVYVLDQHVPGGLMVGTHKGRPALVQRKPFLNVRWPPSRGVVPTVDDLEALAASGQAFTDNRATNIHNRHSDYTPDKPATDDSEGCTVLLWQMDHASMMAMMDLQQRNRGSSIVSPTYVRKSAFT